MTEEKKKFANTCKDGQTIMQSQQIIDFENFEEH